MKNNKKFLDNLNGLLIMNTEVEKIYLELISKVSDEGLKSFFREKGIQRNEFCRDIKLEIINLGGGYKYEGRLSTEFYKFWMNIRNFVLFNEDEGNLVHEVREMQALTINKYNDSLRALSLPLSTCKLLMKHRDSIQEAMDAIDRQDLVAYA
ncbi:DUF2383 domain-containing protein [Tamlana sp. I1]|uniref:DUF2383 domain-containing protein n=1 Tax=Tamlana sp. I1 TaxID=2762061 RepID=UPI0018904499|nr:DUF2383 domain-containing protein [Tamlana sp. I1]